MRKVGGVAKQTQTDVVFEERLVRDADSGLLIDKDSGEVYETQP